MHHPRPPRHRRRPPRRTGPIRNAGEAFRDGIPPSGSAPPWDDAAAHGVREGYRMINEQIRRGHRAARELDGEDPYQPRAYAPYRGGRDSSSDFQPRPSDPQDVAGLVQEILRLLTSGRPSPWRLAELILRLQLAVVSQFAQLGLSTLGGFPAAPQPYSRHSGYTGDDYLYRNARQAEQEVELYGEVLDWEEEDEEWEEDEDAWDWSGAPGAPTTIRANVPIPVYVSSRERTEIDLDLPAGVRLPELGIEPTWVSDAGLNVRPPFEAELVALVDGPVILRIDVPPDLPAGQYRRRVLDRATGQPVGAVVVQIGRFPVESLEAREETP